jgi:hypothetical protein
MVAFLAVPKVFSRNPIPFSVKLPNLRLFTMASAPPSLKCPPPPPAPASYKDDPTPASGNYEPVPPYDPEDIPASLTNLEPIIPLSAMGHFSPDKGSGDKESEHEDSLYDITPAGGNKCLSCQKRSRIGRLAEREKMIFYGVFGTIFLGFLLMLCWLIGRAVYMSRCRW